VVRRRRALPNLQNGSSRQSTRYVVRYNGVTLPPRRARACVLTGSLVVTLSSIRNERDLQLAAVAVVAVVSPSFSSQFKAVFSRVCVCVRDAPASLATTE